MKLLQFSPQASTRVRSQMVPDELGRGYNSAGVTSLSSWMMIDGSDGEAPRVNWGAISGLVISLAFSAGCWAVLGFLIQRVWK